MAFGAFAESIGERAEPKDAQEKIDVGLEHLDPQCLHIYQISLPRVSAIVFYK